MSYTCEIKEQPAQPVLSLRTRAAVQDLPQVLGKAFGAIGQYLGALGETPAGMPFCAYYNLDMQNLDVQIGFPVSKKLAGNGEIQSGEISGGKQASLLYIGPYEQMEPAYDALSKFATANGYEPTGVAYEFYQSGPETPPQEIKTLIMFPLNAK